MIAAITGPRDRQATIAELEQLAALISERGITVLRHGDCPWSKRGGLVIPSIDRSVGSWVMSRALAAVEPWPANWGQWGRAAGPRRNRGMLDGQGQADLFGAPVRPPAALLIRFGDGGRGTADCAEAAEERRIETVRIDPALEPRPWNVHWGKPDGPMIYVGRGHPLGNPTELGDGERRADAAAANLDAYRKHLGALVRANDRAVLDALDSLTPAHHLACSCWPAHCHVEVVIRAWRWRKRSAGGAVA